LGDLHPCGLDPASATADNHALAVSSRESSAHKVEYLPDRKAMRSQHRLGAAVAGSGEQFECATAVGPGGVAMLAGVGAGGEAAAAGLGHGVMAAVLGRCLKDIGRPGTIRGRTHGPRPRDPKAR